MRRPRVQPDAEYDLDASDGRRAGGEQHGHDCGQREHDRDLGHHPGHLVEHGPRARLARLLGHLLGVRVLPLPRPPHSRLDSLDTCSCTFDLHTLSYHYSTCLLLLCALLAAFATAQWRRWTASWDASRPLSKPATRAPVCQWAPSHSPHIVCLLTLLNTVTSPKCSKNCVATRTTRGRQWRNWGLGTNQPSLDVPRAGPPLDEKIEIFLSFGLSL